MMQPRERFLNFLSHQEIDRPPIWLMRQAGRYLPEYLETRKKALSFKNLCYDPELACEVALQPLDRFDLDASIVFADILNLIEACGIPVEFQDNVGPIITQPFRHTNDCDKLKPFDHQLDSVLKTIQLIRNNAPNRGMIGFIGSPWTLACYAVEGKITKDLKHIKALLYSEPETLRHLLDHLTLAATKFAQQQIDAGCDCIMIFDTWGGYLPYNLFDHWSLSFQEKIVQSLKPHPVFLFTRGSHSYLNKIIDTKPAGVCIDWTCPLDETLKRCQANNIILQGNFDPSLLLATPNKFASIIDNTLDKITNHNNYLPSLGHGLMPHIDPSHVALFVEHLKTYNWQLS